MLKTRFNALVTQKEYEHIKKKLGREPNGFELQLFSATYSEHCSYKHSKELLKLLPRENAIFYEENAGGIEIGEHAILFKMESHNHPCAVEPFNGAATGVGGIIRDVLAMNARPIALCNSLKFGSKNNSNPEPLPSPLAAALLLGEFASLRREGIDLSIRGLGVRGSSVELSRIINGVVEGISVYGNSIGVPTVSTEVLFDDCFSENPLVNISAIGLAKKSDILTSSTAKNGLKLMLVGSATMRDGLGGAAFASKKLSDEKAEDKISIQIANPFMKKKLIEACLEIFSQKLVVSCQDCGAAGILSSTSEVAYKSGCGVEIDLSKIHIADKSIKDFEIMLSETQERMLFVVEECKIDEIARILTKFELEYSIIANTIKEKNYVVKNGDNLLANLPCELLVAPPEIELDFGQNAGGIGISPFVVVDGNCAEIYEQYDYTVGARTQFSPTLTSLRDNSLNASQKMNERSNLPKAEPNFNSLWIYEENCFLGIYTFSVVIQENPFKEVYEAILTASKSLTERGFQPKGITNCLNFANPEIPPTMYEFRETILAIKKSCEELKIPVCSGNVSFYNESSLGKIKNTPSFTMIGVKTES
ncbi:MAG: AIR synthase-related protein [bacterium]